MYINIASYRKALCPAFELDFNHVVKVIWFLIAKILHR